LDARIVDGLAIGGMVAAVDAAACEVDADVGSFEMLGPWAEVCAVPEDGLPGGGERAAREDGDVMTALLKIRREDLTYLAATAGHDNAKPARLGGRNDLHFPSVQCRSGLGLNGRRRWGRIVAGGVELAVAIIPDYAHDESGDSAEDH